MNKRTSANEPFLIPITPDYTEQINNESGKDVTLTGANAELTVGRGTTKLQDQLKGSRGVSSPTAYLWKEKC